MITRNRDIRTCSSQENSIMVSYSYKDHEYRLSPAVLLVCCWDSRAGKPTSFFWALFCIISFAVIHWYLSPGQPQNNGVFQQVPDEVKPENPKFKVIDKGQFPEEPMKPPAQDPDPGDEEFKDLIQENAREQQTIPKDLFVRDGFQPHGDQPQLPLDHDDHRAHPKDFPVGYVNEPRLECGPDGYLLLVLVEDRPDDTGARLAIRSTWGIQDEVKYPNLSPKKWKTIFVMGHLRGKNADYFNNAVNSESKKFGDILQGDFEDNAHESTRKSMMAMKWFNDNKQCRFKFILKTRTNIYKNMVSITEWLEKRWGPGDTKLYVGRILKEDPPIRDPKNPQYVPPEDYRHDFFPAFIEGPVMLFDWTAYERLYGSITYVKAIAMDDAYIGLLAQNGNIPPQHNDHFQLLKPPSNVCAQLKVFFMNKIMPNKHIEIFNALKNAQVNGQCPDAKIFHHKEGLNPRRIEI